MFLVRFRVTEKSSDSWRPRSYIYEECVQTDNEGYAKIRSYQELEKELGQEFLEVKNYDISLISIRYLKVIV